MFYGIGLYSGLPLAICLRELSSFSFEYIDYTISLLLVSLLQFSMRSSKGHYQTCNEAQNHKRLKVGLSNTAN